MIAAIAQVTQVCEEAQLDWKTVASIDHVVTTWFMRRHGARTVHLQDLQEYRVASWIWEGHARLIIQSDGEPAFLLSFLLSETEVIADGRADQTVCQISPTSSHESSGAAERTVQQMRGMVRVYWEHECDKTGSVFPSSSPWWVWALRQAARTYNRFHCSFRHPDNAVFPKTRLKVYAQPGLPFGYFFWPESQVRISNTLLGARLVYFARDRFED